MQQAPRTLNSCTPAHTWVRIAYTQGIMSYNLCLSPRLPSCSSVFCHTGRRVDMLCGHRFKYTDLAIVQKHISPSPHAAAVI